MCAVNWLLHGMKMAAGDNRSNGKSNQTLCSQLVSETDRTPYSSYLPRPIPPFCIDFLQQIIYDYATYETGKSKTHTIEIQYESILWRNIIILRSQPMDNEPLNKIRVCCEIPIYAKWKYLRPHIYIHAGNVPYTCNKENANNVHMRYFTHPHQAKTLKMFADKAIRNGRCRRHKLPP